MKKKNHLGLVEKGRLYINRIYIETLLFISTQIAILTSAITEKETTFGIALISNEIPMLFLFLIAHVCLLKAEHKGAIKELEQELDKKQDE